MAHPRTPEGDEFRALARKERSDAEAATLEGRTSDAKWCLFRARQYGKVARERDLQAAAKKADRDSKRVC